MVLGFYGSSLFSAPRPPNVNPHFKLALAVLIFFSLLQVRSFVFLMSFCTILLLFLRCVYLDAFMSYHSYRYEQSQPYPQINRWSISSCRGEVVSIVSTSCAPPLPNHVVPSSKSPVIFGNFLSCNVGIFFDLGIKNLIPLFFFFFFLIIDLNMAYFYDIEWYVRSWLLRVERLFYN